jgi:hypothetical protein
MKTPGATLLFTVALGGYAGYYGPLIQTHQEYADRHGYDHRTISRPLMLFSPHDAAWGKLVALQEGLGLGYDTVVSLDADMLIRPATPPIDTMLMPDKSIYMATGVSGYVNSGFVVLRRGDPAVEFLRRTLARAGTLAPEKYRTRFENGHVIAETIDDPALEVIDQRWNNSVDRDMDDWVHHYTSGLKRDYNVGGIRARRWATLVKFRELQRHHLPGPRLTLIESLERLRPKIQAQLA